MTQLSVNVNKLATLRNSREKNLPNVSLFAQKILSWGAHGITVHPRPDGRHIRRDDVFELADLVKRWNQSHSTPVEFNVEGYPSTDFMTLIQEIRPDQATLVPDPPEALTSNAGWDLFGREKELAPILADLKALEVRSSLFFDPADFSPEQEESLRRLRPDRIELYTEAFSDAHSGKKHSEVLNRYQNVAERAHALGIGINAGHDLNQSNLGDLVKAIPFLAEVSIGHALICEALDNGMENTVKSYLRILGESRHDHSQSPRS
ncbi:MAG: pyridoxine 5'-phosphate synthase [Bdellovibrionales bacterium]